MTLCRVIRQLVLVALLGAAPGLALAGSNSWTSNGPAGQWMRTFAQSPSTLYAGSQIGGVFESTDNGASWNAINTGMTGSSVFALAVDPITSSTLYAGTTDAGLFRSIDSGDNWTAINTGLTTPSVIAIAIDSQTPTTIYAGTNGGGVFKTLDGGDTWTAINTGSTATIVQTLAIDPTNSDVVYMGATTEGVFKSLDGGLNWTRVAVVPELVFSIAIDPTAPDTVYVGSALDGIFKSTNGGDSWFSSSTGILASPATIRELVIDPANPSILYAGSPFGGVFVSLNFGLSWAVLNTGLANLNVSAIHLDNATPTLIYAGTVGSGVSDYSQEACDDEGTSVTCGACETCSPAFGCIGDVWLGCRVSTHLRKAKLTIKDKDPDSRDRMVWTLTRGEETLVEAFGDPVTTTNYDACIFDESAGPPALVMHTDVLPALECNNKPCWNAIGDHAFKYRNGDGVPNGATKLILKSGVESKTKVIFKAKGELLEIPPLPFNLPFRFQMRNDLGECWEAIYTEAGVSKNDDASFVGKDGL